jgi:pimeloyl-ACP methyl ester carboxylesterase
MPVAAKLYYFASGADNFDRPPVILIHGAGGHHLYWPPQIRRLHDQRIFAPDLPGHGKSGGLGCHTVADYAEALLAFIKAMQFSRAVLVGHSMGSAIAMLTAIHMPKMVLGLVLLGSGPRLRVAPALLQSTAQASTFPSAISLINELSFARQTSPRLKELAAQRMAEMRPSVLHGDFLACNGFDVTAELTMISMPTLVLCGAADKMTPPKNSEFLQEHIAGSRLEILANAGHMLMLEQPDQVADLLIEFLDSVAYRPGS